jgi:2-amino-4-hydroxy-6-hydroxymethyldihydropteridine diphosphokinase
MEKHRIYLLLGSNLGERKELMDQAVSLVIERIGPVIQRSSFYETEPWGFSSDALFLNRALQVQTSFSPREVMQNIDGIENKLGRERSGREYSSRTIDIDILFYDDIVLKEEHLEIPHPRLQERRFVLVPLDEIAPDLVHPVFRKTVRELLKDCTDTKNVRKFGD